jgi:hypothetical protein
MKRKPLGPHVSSCPNCGSKDVEHGAGWNVCRGCGHEFDPPKTQCPSY